MGRHEAILRPPLLGRCPVAHHAAADPGPDITAFKALHLDPAGRRQGVVKLRAAAIPTAGSPTDGVALERPLCFNPLLAGGLLVQQPGELRIPLVVDFHQARMHDRFRGSQSSLTQLDRRQQVAEHLARAGTVVGKGLINRNLRRRQPELQLPAFLHPAMQRLDRRGRIFARGPGQLLPLQDFPGDFRVASLADRDVCARRLGHRILEHRDPWPRPTGHQQQSGHQSPSISDPSGVVHKRALAYSPTPCKQHP